MEGIVIYTNENLENEQGNEGEVRLGKGAGWMD